MNVSSNLHLSADSDDEEEEMPKVAVEKPSPAPDTVKKNSIKNRIFGPMLKVLQHPHICIINTCDLLSMQLAPVGIILVGPIFNLSSPGSGGRERQGKGQRREQRRDNRCLQGNFYHLVQLFLKFPVLE